ncbi:MAG: efflux RND transporter periplasmic adaptor subunit [Cellvibrio sp.]
MPLSPAFRERFQRLQRNHLLVALILAGLLVLWIASGDFLRAQDEPPEAPPAAEEPAAFRVETSVSRAEPHSPVQVVQGELLPMREVEILSQINAHLTERPVGWGDVVKAGQTLFKLDPETRAAELARAEAALKLSQAELKGGEVLHSKQLLSETELLRLKSAAASAYAERELRAQQLRYSEIRAPFAGVVDRLPAEEGNYVQVGDSLATLVDIDKLRLVAYVPQQQVYALRPGLSVEAKLLDGSALRGTLTFVASRAESSTRSFRVEAQLENPERRRIAGSSATLSVQLADQNAHRLSPALLSLGEKGELGIKSVDDEGKVIFLPVEIFSFDPEGVWVGGLPEEVEIITLGAGFVKAGDLVNPVDAGQR